MRLVRALWFVLWLYACKAFAFSLDPRSSSDSPIQLYDVEELEFTPRQDLEVALKRWQVRMKVRGVSYLIDLEEIGSYRDKVINVLSTRGTACSLSNGESRACGSARFIISEPHSINRSLRGSFQAGNTIWHLQAVPKYQVWSENELETPPDTSPLGFAAESNIYRRAGDELMNTNFGSDWPTAKDLKEALSNTSDTVAFPDPVVARVGIAADYNFIKSFPSPVEARLHIADMVNKASQLWEQTFNVSLLLKELIPVENSNNNSYSWNIPCDNNGNTDTMSPRLQALTDWRQRERPKDGLATWSLLTNCPSGDVVGLAWQGTVCGPSGINVVRHNALDYKVLAHELGHNFGAVHDCTASGCGGSTVCCPLSTSSCDSNGAYIMSPGTSEFQTEFSPCSRSNIISGVLNGELDTRCLVGKSASSDPPVWESQCASTLNVAKLNTCMRNAQCADYSKSNSSYYCGTENDCRLTCFNPRTQKCEPTELALLNGTPCGTINSDSGSNKSSNSCNEGSCKSGSTSSPSPGPRPRPRPGRTDNFWMWIGIAAGVATGIVVFIVGMVTLLKRNRTESAQNRAPLKVETGKFRANEWPIRQ